MRDNNTPLPPYFGRLGYSPCVTSNIKLMNNILGKAAKTVDETWKLVKNSEQKLSKQQLSKTTAVVFQSKYDEDKLVARVTVGNQYVDFTVDIKCDLKAGNHIKPSSIRVYTLTNGEVEITRLWGEAL